MSKFNVGDRVIFKNPLPGSRRTCGEVINVQAGSPVVHVKVRGRGEYSVPETQLYIRCLPPDEEASDQHNPNCAINEPSGDDNELILPRGVSSSINDFPEVPLTQTPSARSASLVDDCR